MRTTRLFKSARDKFHFLRDSPFLAGLAVFAVFSLAGLLFCFQKTVPVQICLDAPTSGGLKVYYRSKPNQSFTELRCISVRMAGTPAVADINIPARKLWGLKFDFGSAPGEFTVLGGRVGDIPFPPWRKWRFTSDVEVTGDVNESKELKLFSSGTNPCMSVSFRKPIRSSPKPRALSRERLAILLSLALAATLATCVFLGQRPKIACCAPNTGKTDLSWICLLFVMAFFFFVGVRTASCGWDMWDHIAVAKGIDPKDLLRPLEFWRRHYYPMWHLLVRLIKGTLHLESITLAAGLANGLCYNACLIGIYAFLKQTFRKVDPCALIGMAFAVCTAGCMLGPWLNFGHLYENTHNAWWNPTNTMVMALALPCVLLTAHLWDRLSDSRSVRSIPWRQLLLLSIVLVLTELAKPSFIQVYLPALVLFFAAWLLANPKSIRASFLISLALIAPCLLLLSQYLLAFDSGNKGGIGFGFMIVAGHYQHAGLNQFYAVAFPMAALVVSIHRRNLHTEDVLCWLMLLVGMFMKWFLFELGWKMTHGNLGWGSKVALYLVWATSIRQYVDFGISQKGIWSRLGFWVLSIILLLHVVMGFYMMCRWLVLMM